MQAGRHLNHSLHPRAVGIINHIPDLFPQLVGFVKLPADESGASFMHELATSGGLHVRGGRCMLRPMPDLEQERLLALIDERAYRDGEFTLASGKRSSFYFDTKAILLDGEGVRLVARLLLERIARLPVRP